METRLKMRISRMFRGSFGKCRTRNLSDVNENVVSATQNLQVFLMIEPLPPKARPFPTMCKPRCPKTTTQALNDSIFRRQKAPSRFPSFILTNRNGQTYCPSASPIFPLDPFYEELGFEEKQKSGSRSGKKKKSEKSNTVHAKSPDKREKTQQLSSTSRDSAYFEGSYFFSSEEDEREDESDTLFSSRSLSSDSSRSLRHHRRSRRIKHGGSRRRRANTKISAQVGLSMDGKVKDSFAVVKSTSDPYNDFRTSMVEMIVEKQIFAANDLEQLLQCFLSLNSDRHHRIIVAVFEEILETLVSNWY